MTADWFNLPERFRSKVRVDQETGCWLWTAGTDGRGYGLFWHGRRGSGGKMHRAHRWAYEVLVGPIPDGLELDHLCRVRPCVNPDHLEPVTHLENVRRGILGTDQHPNRLKTHCKQGHPFSPENTRVGRDGKRACRTCHRRWLQEWKARANG